MNQRCPRTMRARKPADIKDLHTFLGHRSLGWTSIDLGRVLSVRVASMRFVADGRRAFVGRQGRGGRHAALGGRRRRRGGGGRSGRGRQPPGWQRTRTVGAGRRLGRGGRRRLEELLLTSAKAALPRVGFVLAAAGRGEDMHGSRSVSTGGGGAAASCHAHLKYNAARMLAAGRLRRGAEAEAAGCASTTSGWAESAHPASHQRVDQLRIEGQANKK
jgi:hypothetical protein